MIALLAAVLAFLTTLLELYARREQEKASASTPDQKAKDDEDKMEHAVAAGDVGTINDQFNELHKDRGQAGGDAG